MRSTGRLFGAIFVGRPYLKVTLLIILYPATRIILAVSFAVPVCSLCIARRLYRIASSTKITISQAEKRRAVMIDLAIGVGYPLVMTALRVPLQFRLGIPHNLTPSQIMLSRVTVSISSKTLAVFHSLISLLALVLVFAQPVIIGSMSFLYSMMAIRLFFKRNATNPFLAHHSNLSSNRYIRLMGLAGVELALTIPIGIWFLFDIIRHGVNPWVSWEDTHLDFGRVDQWPAISWRTFIPTYEITRGMNILCAFVFFGLFGLTAEVRKGYSSVVESVVKVGLPMLTLTGRRNIAGEGAIAEATRTTGSLGRQSHPAMPIHIPREALQRQPSIDSFISTSSRDSAIPTSDHPKKPSLLNLAREPSSKKLSDHSAV